MHQRSHPIHHLITRHIKSLLCQVPWRGFIKGLRSGLTTMEMATFLSRNWLSDVYIYTMLSVTRHLCHSFLSGTDPCMEIASPNFTYHVFNSPLLSMIHITSDYSHNAPKSIVRLGDKLQCATLGILIMAVSYSPENHWACLLIDSQTKTISWGNSIGHAMPTGGKDQLRVWLSFFLPHVQFLPL